MKPNAVGTYANEIGAENYSPDFPIMRYGSLKPCDLRPTILPIEEYVKDRDFKSMSEEAIITTLSSDFQSLGCHPRRSR